MFKLFGLIFLSSSLFSNAVNTKIISNDAKKAFTSEYSIAEDNKAFAQSPGGAWAYSAGKVNLESARLKAEERCNGHLSDDDKPCKIINENGKWIK
jgi:hypothetical protein